MNSEKKFLIVFALFSIFVILFAFFRQNELKNEVILNGKAFFVETANTPAAMERGLSGHAPLADNQGMLFVFPTPGNYGFWMKDMTFPLDIIWFDANLRVTHIEKALSPDTYPTIFYPNADSLYVLEVNAGQADATHLKVGDVEKILK